MSLAVPGPRRALLLATFALWSTGARGQEVAIAWDSDLAFDFDRAQYEQSLRQIVSQGYATATGFLGLRRTGTLQVTVYTRERYEKVFGPESQRRGAHYSRGAIHVNGGNRLDGHFAGEMAHEMTHAVLDYRGSGHRLPAWFNEGLAEYVGWSQQGLEGLAGRQTEELKRTAEHGMPPLETREPLSPFQYLQSYAAVVFIEQNCGHEGLLRIVRRTLQGEAFESTLREETHSSKADLERAFVAWVERL